MPSPQAQHRVNFEPIVAEANLRQSPTSYIIPPTATVSVYSAVDQDQMTATPEYKRGVPLIHEARPSIVTEMPADNFYYQPRSGNIVQNKEQPEYDVVDTQTNPGYHQYVQG